MKPNRKSSSRLRFRQPDSDQRTNAVTMPTLFIGCATESMKVAQLIRKSIQDVAHPIVWNEGVFRVGRAYLEDLMMALEAYDFAVFVFAPVDTVKSRGSVRGAPRDNVLFELGLFMGRLGRERVFVIRNAADDVKILSDLHGISEPSFTYRVTGRSDSQEDAILHNAVSNACHDVREAIQRLGPIGRPRIDHPIVLGATRHLNAFADSALSLEDRASFRDQIRDRVRMQRSVPTKLLYYTDDAVSLWLEICRDRRYRFFNDSVRQLRRVARDIAATAQRLTRSREFDLVSLGVGDGTKDALLLHALFEPLTGTEMIHYYPVDISEAMLIRGIAKATGGISHDRLRLKAIIGDITRLPHYKDVYELRSSCNLFSILGNTLGNNDEADIVDALAKAMFPGDLVLVEVNASKVDAKALSSGFVRDDLYLRHDFSPLATIGVPFDPHSIEYELRSDLSQVPRTTSVAAVVKRRKGRKIEGVPGSNPIVLSVIHHYNTDELASFLSVQLDATVVYRQESDGVALLMLQRNVKSK